MKRFIWAVLGVVTLVVAGLLYLNRPKALAIPAVEAGTGPSNQVSGEQRPPAAAPSVNDRIARAGKPTTDASSPANDPLPLSSVTPDKSMLSQIVDTLVSSQATYEQKRSAWKQLREGGKLDQAIGELEQRMAADPRAAEYPAALGHAYLQKCGVIHDVREQGILGMQADKLFDTALNLDPANWEARYMKAVALTYWPASMNKGPEIIDHFQTLVEQQETQPAQPQFAETYVRLGDQYEKAGQTDQAKTTWQRGLRVFPQNEELKKKLGTAQ